MNTNIITINRKRLFTGIAIWWFIFVALSLSGINDFQILNIVGFISLIILPGFLTLMTIRLAKLETWGNVGLIVGVSLIEIIAAGLTANTFLPLLGIGDPLAKQIMLIVLTVLMSILFIIAWARNKNIAFPIERKFVFFDSFVDFLLAFSPLIFVAMSILGSIRLNNGGDGIITLLMLVGIGAYLTVLISKSRTVTEDVIPTGLFFISLALLLMTSLRGWYITGHDIQMEYRVFELAKNNSFWSIQSFRDAYNACMSITILPTIFYKLLLIPDPYIYKVIFQIIFATAPSILYLTLNKYAERSIALISVIYFLAFPTFFTDMPMLNRQEVAFLFLALMSYVLFTDRLSFVNKKYLFVVFSIGMILSHYSTTYAVIAILIFVAFSRPIISLVLRYFKKRKTLSGSGIDLCKKSERTNLITIPMVIFLAAASFFWSSIVTNTSSGSISRVINGTIAAIKNNASEDARSGDTVYSLFYGKKIDPMAELEQYNNNIAIKLRNNSLQGTFYSDEEYKQYPITTVVNEISPITPFGLWLQRSGIDIVSFNRALRSGSAKILQILIIIGLISVYISRRFIRKPLDLDFVLLSAGSLTLIFSQIILPNLSVEYGLLRAFQQSLFFLSIFIVIGSFTLASVLRERFRTASVTIIAIVFFFSSTGVFTYILGGYGQQLHLSNNGAYYDLYYFHDKEAAGIEWLSKNIKNEEDYQSEAQCDRYSLSKASSLVGVSFLNDIYPGIIRQDSYVFLGYTNVNKHQSSIFYNGDILTYSYPIEFLDNNKDLLYSNNGAEIYR